MTLETVYSSRYLFISQPIDYKIEELAFVQSKTIEKISPLEE